MSNIIRDEDTDWSVFEKSNTKDAAGNVAGDRDRSAERAQQTAEAVAASGPLQLGGLGLLILAAPTPEDEILIRMEFRRQCLPLLKTPLQQIADDVRGLPADLAAIAVRSAVELQAGHAGKGEPSEEMIFSRLYTPEGCAFRVWALARAAHPGLTLKQVQAEINEGNVVETLANMWRAFQPDDKKKAGERTSNESGQPPGPPSSANS